MAFIEILSPSTGQLHLSQRE